MRLMNGYAIIFPKTAIWSDSIEKYTKKDSETDQSLSLLNFF